MGTFVKIFFGSMSALLVVFYLDASYLKGWPFNGWGREDIGQWGDSWGFVTSIFSVAAFFGVLYSMELQSKALKHSQEMTVMQAQALGQQAFESNLLQMLSIFQSIIEGMDLRKKATNEVVYQGRDVFYFFYEKHFKKLCENDDWNEMHTGLEVTNTLSERYSAFFEYRQQDLGVYMRYIYNIFKFIDTATVPESKKMFYGRMVRAQLSNYELYILFYNCFFIYGKPFEKYVTRFAIFDNLHIPGLLHSSHRFLIDREAFGDNHLYDDEHH